MLVSDQICELERTENPCVAGHQLGNQPAGGEGIPPWNGAYTARGSLGQPHVIVVIDKKLLKFEKGHRATR